MASINAIGVLQFYLLEKSQPTGLIVTSSVYMRENYNKTIIGFTPLLNITNYSTRGVDISLGLRPRKKFSPQVE